jgi:uncharacterized membrane protein YqjE
MALGAPQDRPSSDAAPASVRGALRTLLSFVETRARLAANEVEEQGLRLLEVAMWAAAAFIFFALALVFIAFFVVILFWDSNRLLAAGLVAGLFVAGGAGSVLMARSGLAARPKFLAATLAELEKDRQKVVRP